MKILIIRFSSTGDIVLTTPVIRCIKTQIDQAEVHVATKKEYAFLMEENPYIIKTHILDKTLKSLITELKKEKFDLVIDLHKNLRTALIKLRLDIRSRTFDKLNFQKWLLTAFKINVLPNQHIVDRYMQSVESFGVKMDNLGLDYFIPDRDHVEIDWLPEAFQNGYVAVVIGGQFATKKLPKDRLIELCDRINKPVILLGGKEEEQMGREIEEFFKPKNDQFTEGLKALGKQTIVFNTCGKFNFNQSASLIKQSRWVFTHDTGLMHVAAAFKKEIYSIWGNTIPEFGMYPYRTKFVIFEKKDLKCRPCSKIGFEKCPKGHFKCMNEVKFDFYLPD